MNWRLMLILGVTGLLIQMPPPALADRQPCDTPFNHSANSLSAEQQRQIAELCGESAIASLYYNRAYHQELLQKFRVINRLQSHQPNADLAHYHSQRLFIALSEAFAERAWVAGDPDAVSALNRQYDHSIEITEYQLKGYDRLASRRAARPDAH